MVPVVPCFVVPKPRAAFIGSECRGAQMVPEGVVKDYKISSYNTGDLFDDSKKAIARRESI